MKRFVIDQASGAKAYAPRGAGRKRDPGSEFATEKEFAAASADWPMPRLVAVWNNLPGLKPVRKFTDRATALRRIWSEMQALAPPRTTKTELVISLLKRPSGATLNEIVAATGWQAHSVRALISAKLSKKLGLRVTSFKRDGERVYRIR